MKIIFLLNVKQQLAKDLVSQIRTDIKMLSQMSHVNFCNLNFKQANTITACTHNYIHIVTPGT